MIWGVKLGYRPPGRAIWGSVLPFRPPRASNLGGRFTLPTTPSIKFGGHFRLSGSSEVKFGGSDWGIDLPGRLIWGSDWTTDLLGRVIWGVRLDQRPPGKCNFEGRIRLFTCFTPKIFTHYLIVEWIRTPIFFENKVINLLDSLSKGARFETRGGREWEQEHMFEGLKAWR